MQMVGHYQFSQMHPQPTTPEKRIQILACDLFLVSFLPLKYNIVENLASVKGASGNICGIESESTAGVFCL